MHAAFKYIEGRKTGNIRKSWEKFAKITVTFTTTTGDKKELILSRLTGHLNIMLTGSPLLTVQGCGFGGAFSHGAFAIKGDPENPNPADIHFTIFKMGCYKATSSAESTLFMRMKPFITKLFAKVAHQLFDDGDEILIHIQFEDEIVTEIEECVPDEIFFSCLSKPTKEVCGLSRIKIVYNKDVIGAGYDPHSNIWCLDNLESIIVPDAVRARNTIDDLEKAFLDLAKNMFLQSPIPDDAKLWNFKTVTKTVTDVVLI